MGRVAEQRPHQYNMKKISFRDVVAYPGQGPASNFPSAYPANPFNPNAGEPRRFQGTSTDAPQCPDCYVMLLIDDKDNVGTCPNCNSRFSKVQYDAAYSKRATNPGLFNLDGGNSNSDSGPDYHKDNPGSASSGSWTVNLNQNQHYN